jgi:hypothetical protein
MSKRALNLLALASAFVVLIAGCGSSDATLSKSEFIAKADAACKKADKTQAGEAAAYQRVHAKEFASLSEEERIEKLIDVVLLPSIKREAEGIEALPPPSDDEQKVQGIVKGIEKAIKEAEKDPGSVETSTGSGGPFHDVDKLAREYGFKECNEII